MFYLTLIPLLIAIPVVGFLPGKSGIKPRTIAIFAAWSILPVVFYDWSRVPMNLIVGVPFWDHWFDWGASIIGSTGTIFTYENLTVGLIAHILRGWGFAMAYYILTRRVTLLSAFVFSWFMTVLYWAVFPVYVLTDALPPWIWWFTAWESHLFFAIGLWFAPKLADYLKSGSMGVERQRMMKHGTWKTTLLGFFALQGFALLVGATLFGYIVSGQPPSIYPVFGYGKPPPIIIDGFVSYYWAIIGAIIGFFFLYLTMKSYQKSINYDAQDAKRPA
jgi:hypothetical protein